MAKDSNEHDETPIRFHIPFRGGVYPINQPHWIHKLDSKSKPTLSDWIMWLTFFVIAVIIASLLVIERMFLSPLWLVAASMFFLSIRFIRAMVIQKRKFDVEQDGETGEKSLRASRKRNPKRRKDYR